jgi:hypothetical protein
VGAQKQTANRSQPLFDGAVNIVQYILSILLKAGGGGARAPTCVPIVGASVRMGVPVGVLGESVGFPARAYFEL